MSEGDALYIATMARALDAIAGYLQGLDELGS